MATMNTQFRNILTEIQANLVDAIDIRTSGGTTLLAELTAATFGIPASGAAALSATVTDSAANATGTAAEARIKHTNGAGSGYLVNDVGAAIGDITIVVDTGTGALNEGDVFRFSGHAQDYFLTLPHAGGAGTISFYPRLKVAPADNETITLQTAPEVSGLTVGTSGSDINLNSVDVDLNEQVDITAFTITTPAS